MNVALVAVLTAVSELAPGFDAATLPLDASSGVVSLPTGSVWRLGDHGAAAASWRVWRRTDDLEVWLEQPSTDVLTDSPGAPHTWQVSLPLGGSAVLTRIDDGPFLHDRESWRAFRIDVDRWLVAGAPAEPPLPGWLPTRVRLELTALGALVRVSRECADESSHGLDHAVLRRLAARVLDPIAPRVTAGLDDSRALEPFLVAPGSRTVVEHDGCGVLRFEAAAVTPCASIEVRCGARAEVLGDLGCDGHAPLRSVRCAVGPETRTSIVGTKGEAVVAITHTPPAALWDRAVCSTLDRSARAFDLGRAELLLADGHSREASSLFATAAAGLPADSLAGSWARFRVAALDPSPRRGLDALTALAPRLDERAEHAWLADHVHAAAITRALALHDVAAAQELLGRGADLPPELVTDVLAATHSPLLDAYARKVVGAARSAPPRTPARDAAQRIDGRHGRWKNVAFSTGWSTTWVDEAAADGEGLVVIDRGGTLEVPPDPLGLDRRRRVRVWVVPEGDTVLSILTAGAARFEVPLVAGATPVDLTFLSGRYALGAKDARLLIDAQDLPHGATPTHVARRYTALLPGGALTVPGPELGDAEASITLRLDTPSDGGATTLDACRGSACRKLRVAWAAGSNRWLRVRLPPGGDGEDLTLRRSDDGAPVLWVRAQTRRYGAELPAAEPQPDVAGPCTSEALSALVRGRRLRELRAAVEGCPEVPAARLLAADLGPRGAWTSDRSPREVDIATPIAGLLPAEHHDPGLTAAIRALRAGDLTSARATLEAALRGSSPPDPLCALLWAELFAEANSKEASDLLASLASTRPTNAELFWLAAARRRATSERPDERRRAVVEAVLAEELSAARDLSRRLLTDARWTSVPMADVSAGRARLALRDTGEFLMTDVSTPTTPVELTVRGPVLLRLSMRGIGGDAAARTVIVSEADTRRSIALPLDVDPTLVSGKDGVVGVAEQVLVPIRTSGTTRVRVAPDQGRLAVQFALLDTVPSPPPPTQPTVATVDPRPPLELIVAPMTDDLGTTTDMTTATAGLELPLTLRATSGFSFRERDANDAHGRTTPALPLTISAHRRLGARTWMSATTSHTARFEAHGTTGIGGRVEHGFGPGLQALAVGAGRWQRLAGAHRQGLHAMADLRWEQPLAWGLAVRPELGLGWREVDAALDDGAWPRADAEVTSRFAVTHPRELRLGTALLARPFADLWLRGRSIWVSNRDLGSVDRSRHSLDLFTARPPLVARLGVSHERRLADPDRFLPYRRSALSLSVALRPWLSAGTRVSVEARANHVWQTEESTLLAVVTLDLTGDRGLDDIAPRLEAFRGLSAADEPRGLTP